MLDNKIFAEIRRANIHNGLWRIQSYNLFRYNNLTKDEETIIAETMNRLCEEGYFENTNKGFLITPKGEKKIWE